MQIRLFPNLSKGFGGIILSLVLPATVVLNTTPSFGQCCNYLDSGQNLGTSPTFGVALGDFDGDGDQDAFTIDAYEDIEIYFNNGAGVFTLAQTITPIPDEEDNFGVHVFDVDNDNDIDAIVVPFYNSSGLKIYKNDGTGNFTLFQTVSSNLGSRYAGIADVDGDGDRDVILPGGMSSTTKVFKNNGNGYFTQFSSITLTNFGQANDIATGDMDGDFDIDAVVISSNAGGRLLLNDGTGNLSDAGITIGNTADSYYTAEAGDMDKDGDADLVFGGMYCPLTVIKNLGGTTFVVDSSYASSNYDKHMILADYDFDGDPDVFVSTYGSYGLEVWTNDGECKLSLCYQNQPPMPNTYSHGFDIGLIDNDIYLDAFMGEFGSSGDKVFFAAPAFYVINQQASICEGEVYTFPDGTTATVAMVQTSHLTAMNGCDSIIITDLSMIIVNTAVTLSQATFTAQQAGAVYQWLDCNNAFAQISGATQQSFTATVSGSYAVEVTYDNCTDTSDCVPVVVTGLTGTSRDGFSIRPNPAGDFVIIETPGLSLPVQIRIVDLSGRLLHETMLTEINQVRLSLAGLRNGYYLLHYSDRTGTVSTLPLIKAGN